MQIIALDYCDNCFRLPFIFIFFNSSSDSRPNPSLLAHVWAGHPGLANHNCQGCWCDPVWTNQSLVWNVLLWWLQKTVPLLSVIRLKGHESGPFDDYLPYHINEANLNGRASNRQRDRERGTERSDDSIWILGPFLTDQGRERYMLPLDACVFCFVLFCSLKSYT